MNRVSYKGAALAVAALSLSMLCTRPAMASPAFCDGATTGACNAFFIGPNFTGTNQNIAACFQLGASTNVTTVSFGDWSPTGSTLPTTVTYKIFGCSACGFAGTLESSGTVALTTVPFPGVTNPNGIGFCVLDATFNLAGGGVTLGPGTFWLQLDNTNQACNAWDLNPNGTSSSTFAQCGTFFGSTGNPGHETFAINPNGGGAAAPEVDATAGAVPMGIALGALLILGDRRRKA